MKPARCSPRASIPTRERKRKRHAIVLAGEHTFKAVYEQWLDHRKLSLEEGRQTSLEQIGRVFKKDVFPVLRHLTIYDITRAHLLDIIGKVEKRGSLSVAEKLRTWFTQLFTYATVAIPNMGENPSKDLEVVALPLPPVEHNPFLRMPELPIMLQTLRKYRGRLQHAVGLAAADAHRGAHRRTALRHARSVRPRSGPVDHPRGQAQAAQAAHQKKRKRLVDIPPYIVPLSVQAQEIVRHLLEQFKPAQVHLIPGDWCLKNAHQREHAQRRAQAHGLRGPTDRARHPRHHLHRAQRTRLPEEVGGCPALACRSGQDQRDLQPCRVRRAAAAS
jgi:integrase